MKINCSYSDMVEIHKLVPNPKNPNKHPDDQIERLAKIIDYQGQRAPIVVSNRSGFITKGHGRLEAVKSLGWKEVAVDYQDYDDEAQEYADIVADNAIASWAELQLTEINEEMLSLGPELDIEMLGIKNFEIDPSEVDLPDLGDGSDPDIQQVTFIISNEQKDILDEAMAKAKKKEHWDDGVNQNQNGNIMASIMRHYVNC